MKSWGVVVISAIVIATISARAEAPRKEIKWSVGGWDVTYSGDAFEEHYELDALARPEGKAPLLWIRCTDGIFTLKFLYAFATGPRPFAAIIKSDSGERHVYEVYPERSGSVTIRANRSEYMMSNSSHLGIRFKMIAGKDADFFYKLEDLKRGKPQLFRVCPILR